MSILCPPSARRWSLPANTEIHVHWASQPQLSEAARLFYEQEVERKNEVYAPDLIIKSSLKQLAQWCTDIFGIEEMITSKISEEEIQKPEEKLTLHSHLDSMAQKAAQTNIILQEQIEPPMVQEPCARRDQKEDWPQQVQWTPPAATTSVFILNILSSPQTITLVFLTTSIGASGQTRVLSAIRSSSIDSPIVSGLSNHPHTTHHP